MIQTKEDLKYYIAEDEKVFGYENHHTLIQKVYHWILGDNNLKYMRCLRKLEYYINRRGGYKKFSVICYIYEYLLKIYRNKTGIELYANVAGPGCYIPHGKVVVISCCKIGSHCKLNSDVTIGRSGNLNDHGCPLIGDRVYVGSGVKILGGVQIADDVVIGANSVVINSILEPNTTWAGIPARKISNNGSKEFFN